MKCSVRSALGEKSYWLLASWRSDVKHCKLAFPGFPAFAVEVKS